MTNELRGTEANSQSSEENVMKMRKIIDERDERIRALESDLSQALHSLEQLQEDHQSTSVLYQQSS